MRAQKDHQVTHPLSLDDIERLVQKILGVLLPLTSLDFERRSGEPLW